MSPASESDFNLPVGSELQVISDSLYEHGFVHVRKALTGSLVERVREELDRTIRAVSRDGSSMAYFDDDGEVLSVHGLDKYSEAIFDLTREPALTAFAAGLLRSGVVPFLTEYFAKPSKDAEATPPHQDQAFYNDHFDDELAIALWCPLTEITLGDSPLEYGRPATAPGTLLPHRKSAVRNFGRELSDGFPASYTPVPASPGDIVVHHAFAVHRTRRHAGQGPRQAFAMNFRSSPYR